MLSSTLVNEADALNAGIDTRPYLDMMISSRPGTVNSPSRPQTNQGSRKVSRQASQSVGLGATSSSGDSHNNDEADDPIVPVSWIDNIRPHTANKVSLDFYGAGLEPPAHNHSEPVHESLQSLPSEQVADMEKWLVQLSRACPLKPVDNSAEMLVSMIKAGSSTRVENAHSPLATQILGEKIRQNRGNPGNPKSSVKVSRR
jgi:hypothetical protein